MCFVEIETLRVIDLADGGCIVQLETAHNPLCNLLERCDRASDEVISNDMSAHLRHRMA